MRTWQILLLPEEEWEEVKKWDRVLKPLPTSLLSKEALEI